MQFGRDWDIIRELVDCSLGESKLHRVFEKGEADEISRISLLLLNQPINSAKTVMKDFGGFIPEDVDGLLKIDGM